MTSVKIVYKIQNWKIFNIKNIKLILSIISLNIVRDFLDLILSPCCWDIIIISIIVIGIK